MRILVTTDGSLRSLNALPHAAAFARATNSDLLILRVLDPKTEVERAPGVAVFRAAEPIVEYWTEELRRILSAFSLKAEPAVKLLGRGEGTHDAILRAADESGAHMIAMTSRGSGAIRHAILGSVAMGVVGCSSLPVLIVGPEIVAPLKTKAYRILATSDGSPVSLRGLQAIRPFLDSSSIHITLLRIYVATLGDRGDRVEMRDCRKQIEQLGSELPPGAPVRGIVSRLPALHSLEGKIVKTAERLKANAIVMATHGHGAQHHLLAGSTALGVLARSPVPLILARSGPAAVCK